MLLGDDMSDISIIAWFCSIRHAGPTRCGSSVGSPIQVPGPVSSPVLHLWRSEPLHRVPQVHPRPVGSPLREQSLQRSQESAVIILGHSYSCFTANADAWMDRLAGGPGRLSDLKMDAASCQERGDVKLARLRS